MPISKNSRSLSPEYEKQFQSLSHESRFDNTKLVFKPLEIVDNTKSNEENKENPH